MFRRGTGTSERLSKYEMCFPAQILQAHKSTNSSSRIHTFMLCVCLDAKDELPDFARGLAFQEAVVKGLFHIGFAIKANLPSKLMK